MLTTYSQLLPRNLLSYSGHFSSVPGLSVSIFKLIIHSLLFSLLTKTSSLSIISASSATQYHHLLTSVTERLLLPSSSSSLTLISTNLMFVLPILNALIAASILCHNTAHHCPPPLRSQ